jgi:hypothetical protein
MPRVAIPVTTFTRAGVVPPAETNGDAVNHHTLANSGRTGLIVRNSGAVPRDVIFRFPSTVDGQAITPRTVAIPAGAERWFGPFPTDLYGTEVLIDVANAELKLRGIRVG